MKGRRYCWLLTSILIVWSASPIQAEARTLTRSEQLAFSRAYVRYLGNNLGLKLGNREVLLLFNSLTSGGSHIDFTRDVLSKFGLTDANPDMRRACFRARSWGLNVDADTEALLASGLQCTLGAETP